MPAAPPDADTRSSAHQKVPERPRPLPPFSIRLDIDPAAGRGHRQARRGIGSREARVRKRSLDACPKWASRDKLTACIASRNGHLRRRSHRHRRGRLRRDPHLHDRRLPRFSPRADRDLRREHEPGADLPAVRLEPGPDGAALGVGVAFHAGRLADVRPDGRGRPPQRGAAVPLGGQEVQPGRARDPHRGRRRQPGARLRQARPRRREDRLDHPRARPAGALLALRRGREPGRPLQALPDRDRPRPARLPRRVRRGAQQPRDRRPRGPGLRAEGVPRGRPLPRRRLGHRRRERVGQLRGRGRPVRRAPAQPAPGRAGPERAALPVRRLRHRRLPGPLLRPAHRLHRPGAPRHRAVAAQLGRQGQAGDAGGPLRGVRSGTSTPSGPALPASTSTSSRTSRRRR